MHSIYLSKYRKDILARFDLLVCHFDLISLKRWSSEQKCKANDYSAQLEVYNSYKNMMFGSAIRILKNREEAEDIVQDA